jgi:hypothetical protein
VCSTKTIDRYVGDSLKEVVREMKKGKFCARTAVVGAFASVPSCVGCHWQCRFGLGWPFNKRFALGTVRPGRRLGPQTGRTAVVPPIGGRDGDDGGRMVDGRQPSSASPSTAGGPKGHPSSSESEQDRTDQAVHCLRTSSRR